MSENLVLDLSMQFAIDIVNLCEALKGKNALTNQLLRSGTSIGANIHVANVLQALLFKTIKPIKRIIYENWYFYGRTLLSC